MREILFRAKTKSGGEWVQGFLVRAEGLYTKIINGYVSGGDFYDQHFRVDPETVGQYTGLTDKNGTKIFEGDIISVEYTGENRGLDGTAKVVFEKSKFALEWGWHKEVVCLTDFCNVTFEVIGNIHDNPELLKGAAEQ